jgi:AcrR family transcriptional regulator
MDTRAEILRAAATVFAQHGFRGSTTRRIADEAGVNEVTLFRYFGSKDALLQEAIGSAADRADMVRLPENPVDPRAELTEWSSVVIDYIEARCPMIRKCMGELGERPSMTEYAFSAPIRATKDLCAYFGHMRERGFTDLEFNDVAAASMLIGALFHDAMGRPGMNEALPPRDKAAAYYVDLLLRGIGVDTEPAAHATSAAPRRKTRHTLDS